MIKQASCIVAILMVVSVPPVSSVQSGGRSAAAARGRELVERAGAARGGSARLALVRALRIVDSDTVTTVLWPDAYRVDVKAPFGTIATIFDGQHLSQIWPPGSPPPPTPDPVRARAGALNTLARFALVYLSRPEALGRVTPVAVGRQTWGPVTGEVVRFVAPAGRPEDAWGLVLDSGMLPVAVLAAFATSPGGRAEGYSVIALSDYREVGGIRFPFQTEAHRVDVSGRITQAFPPRVLAGLTVNPPVSKASLVARQP